MRSIQAIRIGVAAVLCGAALSTGAAAQAVTAAVKQSALDTAITAQIETTYLFNRHLNPFNINTTTVEGVVTLTGSVSDEIQRQLAEDIAASIEGVKSVQNDITVIGTILSPRPSRTWRQRIDDLTLAATIRSRLLYHKEYKGMKLGVTSELGNVTLYGVVNSEEQKKAIAKIADETSGVIQVINNLTVQPREAAGVVGTIGRRVADEWIEKRVETALLLNRHLSIRGLDVQVVDGKCILSGTVDADEEKDLAESLAMSILGIDEVQNDIKIYVDPQ